MNYEATLVKVIDGDGVRLKVSLGFNLEGTFDFQLVGLDVPTGRLHIKEAKQALTDLLRKASVINVRPTGERTGAGRWWAAIDALDENGRQSCVNDDLVDLGRITPVTEE